MTGGLVCEISGTIVVPECPPITGTLTSFGLRPLASAMNVLDLTKSKVVTPKSFFGS